MTIHRTEMTRRQWVGAAGASLAAACAGVFPAIAQNRTLKIGALISQADARRQDAMIQPYDQQMKLRLELAVAEINVATNRVAAVLRSRPGRRDGRCTGDNPDHRQQPRRIQGCRSLGPGAQRQELLDFRAASVRGECRSSSLRNRARPQLRLPLPRFQRVAGTTAGDQVMAALDGATLSTATGPVVMGRGRYASMPMYVARATRGNFEVVKKYDAVATGSTCA